MEICLSHQNSCKSPLDRSLQLLLEAYFTGRSKRTIEAYKADLKGFSNYLSLNEYENGVLHLLKANAGEANRLVLMFKNWMIDSGLASNTINRRLASIRSLVKLARSLGMVSFEIEIQNLKVTLLRDTRGPQNFEIQKVFKYLKSKNSAKSTRDIAIFRLLFDLALRASELIYIDLSDFDQSNKIIYIVGKGMREKTPLSLPEPTFQAVM
jgi:integrase/recombinase XerC